MKPIILPHWYRKIGGETIMHHDYFMDPSWKEATEDEIATDSWIQREMLSSHTPRYPQNEPVPSGIGIREPILGKEKKEYAESMLRDLMSFYRDFDIEIREKPKVQQKRGKFPVIDPDGREIKVGWSVYLDIWAVNRQYQINYTGPNSIYCDYSGHLSARSPGYVGEDANSKYRGVVPNVMSVLANWKRSMFDRMINKLQERVIEESIALYPKFLAAYQKMVSNPDKIVKQVATFLSKVPDIDPKDAHQMFMVLSKHGDLVKEFNGYVRRNQALSGVLTEEMVKQATDLASIIKVTKT